MRAVIVSVRYADFLAQTLKPWRNFLPPDTLTVVTAEWDHATQQVARKAGVPVCLTKAWTEIDESCHVGKGVIFNKPLALDYALGLAGKRAPADGELCVTLDADVVPFGTWPGEDRFVAGTLYGVGRYKADNHSELVAHRRGQISLHKKSRYMRNNKPCGYCSMFRYQPGIRFGSYPSAGYYDRDFGKLFHEHVMLEEFYVIHMGVKGGFFNWQRRRLPTWDTRPPNLRGTTAL
jgi:hypothetical protein